MNRPTRAGSSRHRIPRPLLVLALLLALVIPASAQGPGIFVRLDCTTLSSPVTGQTWCFDATESRLKRWTGTLYATVTVTNIPVNATEGGTNLNTSGSTGLPRVNLGTWNIQALTHGQLLIGSTGAVPVPATLTAGNNITVTNAAGSITIASTASGGATAFELRPVEAAFPTSNFPQLVKNSGSFWTDYTLDYDQVTSECAYWYRPIASGVTVNGANLDLYSRQATVTTGNVGWLVTTLSRGDADAWDTNGATDTVTNATVKGTTGQVLWQGATLTTTNWAGGRVLLIRICRNVDSDTVAEDAKLIMGVIRLN